jgi:hypothetical protein
MGPIFEQQLPRLVFFNWNFWVMGTTIKQPGEAVVLGRRCTAHCCQAPAVFICQVSFLSSMVGENHCLRRMNQVKTVLISSEIYFN